MPVFSTSDFHPPGQILMDLGSVSAIDPEYTPKQVLRLAQKAGFSSVELICWPPAKSERRYAGVTHINATDLSRDAGYAKDAAIEVEGEAFEGSLESRLDAPHISRRYLLQYLQG